MTADGAMEISSHDETTTGRTVSTMSRRKDRQRRFAGDRATSGQPGSAGLSSASVCGASEQRTTVKACKAPRVRARF